MKSISVIKEKFKIVDDLKIKYLFKPRKYDCNYLIVVFSGFGATDYFTYDLKNSLLQINANVLWIKDDFNENVAYYYAVNNSQIHNKINKFIENFAKEINIEKKNIILSGFSKGGSAALFYGALYNYKNIISTVPQFKISDYCLKSKKEDVLVHIGVEYNQLNKIILDSIQSDTNLEKNIYFLTSEADEQYISQVESNLKYLYKYENFNLFYSQSILVRSHNQVTSHHLQLIMSWLYSLISGAIPKYGITVWLCCTKI